MRTKVSIILTVVLFALVATGVYLNVAQEEAIDQSKIPQKVEESVGFQRWITNLKNNGLAVSADEFRLKEENEIYNTKWIKISSIDEPDKRQEFETILATHRDTPKVIFSPSDRMFIDYRHAQRDVYAKNEARLYGLKEDKIIDARILDCSSRANCYFDRAFFLNNDYFVITEFSRNIDKKDQTTAVCDSAQMCTYTIKLHAIDLINNKRFIYESQPFDIVLEQLIPEL